MSDTDPVQVEPVTPRQVKAARALLGWSQLQLGLRSDTSIHVVRTFEQTGRVMTVQRRPDLTDPLGAIRATLEKLALSLTTRMRLEYGYGSRSRDPVSGQGRPLLAGLDQTATGAPQRVVGGHGDDT